MNRDPIACLCKCYQKKLDLCPGDRYLERFRNSLKASYIVNFFNDGNT